MWWGLAAVVTAFMSGLGLRRFAGLGPPHADVLLRIVVRVGLPALVFASVHSLPLRAELIWLPFAGALLVTLMWPVAWATSRLLALPRSQRGVIIVGPMIMNLALLYPMVVAWDVQGAVARLALIDFGNAALGFTLVYGLAAWYGDGHRTTFAALRGVLSFPPFWALGVGLVSNLAAWQLPVVLVEGLGYFGEWMVLLVPLALGMYFQPRGEARGLLAAGIALRFGAGMLLGGLCVWWLPLDRLSRVLVMAAAMAPVGFNTLVFAARAGLDRRLAANLASVSIVIGLIVVPAWLWWQLPGGA